MKEACSFREAGRCRCNHLRGGGGEDKEINSNTRGL